MWILLFAQFALAGTVVIDARVPVEVWIDGALIGELAAPAQLYVEAPTGAVAVTLLIGGQPQKETVQVPEVGKALVIVGRTGVTTGTIEPEVAAAAAGGAAAAPDPSATSSLVEFRSAAREDVLLVVGKERVTLAPGTTRKFDLTHGTTQLSLRDSSGTVVWAHGTLDVVGDGLIVQVADGRLPEISGAGSFHPDP